jgi:hypothetical protein
MEWPYWAAILAILGVVALLLVWRPLRRLGGDIQVERARELFLLQRERLEHRFLGAAMATGKPRGLRWKECVFERTVEFARDRRTRQLVALVSVTIQFEAVEGSDMEGLPAVSNLRNASAVFYFHAGHWHTAGKAVFNMNPGEALHHFRNQYEPVRPDERLAGKTEGTDNT